MCRASSLLDFEPDRIEPYRNRLDLRERRSRPPRRMSVPEFCRHGGGDREIASCRPDASRRSRWEGAAVLLADSAGVLDHEMDLERQGPGIPQWHDRTT